MFSTVRVYPALHFEHLQHPGRREPHRLSHSKGVVAQRGHDCGSGDAPLWRNIAVRDKCYSNSKRFLVFVQK